MQVDFLKMLLLNTKQKFQKIVGDKHIALSEISLAFFSETPELLRADNNNRESENKFSLAKLFKSFQINRTEYDDDEDDNDELLFDDPDSNTRFKITLNF